MADKVRFSELDNQNHVNNKAYLTWFESVRIAYHERFCVGHYGSDRPRVLIHSLNLRFVREMQRDESYVATARVTEFRTNSYTMDQQLWSGDLRARMSVVVVMGRADGKGHAPLPASLQEQFLTLDKATDTR